MNADPFHLYTARPVRSHYMERFKDRAWRLFGVKVPIELRPFIRARFEMRRIEWYRRRYGGLLGATLRRFEKEFSEQITTDFILAKLIGDEDIQPKIFKMRQP